MRWNKTARVDDAIPGAAGLPERVPARMGRPAAALTILCLSLLLWLGLGTVVVWLAELY